MSINVPEIFQIKKAYLLIFCFTFLFYASEKLVAQKIKQKVEKSLITVPACQTNLEDFPQVRGFKLGMKLQGVILKYPQFQEDVDSLKSSEVDIQNAKDGLIRIEHSIKNGMKGEDAQVYDSDKSFEGLSNIFLFFFDEELFEIIFEYADYQPRSIKEFQAQTSKALNLPNDGWKFSKPSSWGQFTYKPSAEITCNGFVVLVQPPPEGPGFDNFASLSLTDPNGQKMLDARRKSKKEEAKKRKRVFKP